MLHNNNNNNPNPNPNPPSGHHHRHRFYVELTPGETTIVSWKKLLKDSSSARHDQPCDAAPPGAHPSLASRIAPEVAKETELLSPLPPPPNRFSSVIERIEKLYQGADSDHEEPAVGILQDDADKYDTRDSFIDDTELDDYFQVEATKLKHEGFFINRGKLELQQQQLVESKPTSTGASMGSAKRKRAKKLMISSTVQIMEESGKMNGNKEKSRGVRMKAAARSIHHQQQQPPPSEPAAAKLKPSNEVVRDIAVHDRRTNHQQNSAGNASSSTVIELSDSKKELIIGTTTKAERTMMMVHRHPCSSSSSSSGKEVGRVKGTVLERALMELEKGVAELCPPSLIAREPENGKRIRLPRDVKQKLAKVARLAAKQGKITDDFIERLMGILGHMVQVNTLKRHLKAMVEMGMCAMQEKAGRLQGIKEQVVQMIKSRVEKKRESPAANAQHTTTSEAAGDLELYRWDHAMEDKICDLYDQYVEGMDEDKGPHLRKLYAELAELWPEGLMDNVGIKLAVLRAKERKKQLQATTDLSCSSTEQKKKKKRRRRSGAAASSTKLQPKEEEEDHHHPHGPPNSNETTHNYNNRNNAWKREDDDDDDEYRCPKIRYNLQ